MSAAPETTGAPAADPADGADHALRAWAEIDVGAVRHNAGVLARMAAPAALCAVVKADAYGHGAPAVAKAALDGGASSLAVALVEEGAALRSAGIAAPILLLSEPGAGAMSDVVALGLTPTLYSVEAARALDAAARAAGRPVDVHLKVDTGMHRVGASAGDLLPVAEAVAAADGLRLAALCTHLAVAEGENEEERAFTADQLRRFAAAAAGLAAAGLRPPLLHAANTAGTIGWPAARHDMVRCGIALYGELPAPSMAGAFAAATGGATLRPVMSLRARVSWVRPLRAGDRPSYGRRRALPADGLVATVPVGYADGVPRGYFTAGGEVLVGGRRRPLAGTVTMDQIVVDCGPGAEVACGDEVVLIGRQGDETLSAQEWATRLGTISYEVLCGIGPRVPRVVVDRAGSVR